MKSPLLSWRTDDPVPAELGRTPPGPKRLPAALLDRWHHELRSWDAPPAVPAALERLGQAGTEVVVTGQQPGVWGGPLYSLYKAATAVALAERISRRGNREAVAVFWVQGDDTDWDEIGWGALPHPDLSLFRHRWTPPLESRRWVGSARLHAPEETGALWSAWPSPEAFRGTPAAGEPVDLSRAQIDLLLAYFGDRGLIPLDSRWPEIRRAGAPLWKDYHERHTALAGAVLERGDAMRAAGGIAPLDAEAADHGLFPLDEDRRREIDPDRWPHEVAELLAGDAPERLAPSVLLRAPLQDYLFGTVSQVVGRTEAAYLEQLVPLYDALGIRTPVRTPRLHGTMIPDGLIPLEEVETAVRAPEAWVGDAARSRTGSRAPQVFSALKTSVEAGLEEATVEARSTVRDFPQLAESARKKILGQIARLEETVDRRARQVLYRERPELRHLPEFLRPRRGEQDRGLSAAALGFLFGEAAPDAVLAAARAHLDRLEGGESHHFVLEGRRV